MELPSISTIIFATIGGFIPTIIWLVFWHKQDSQTPEPKHMVILTFLGGTLAVLISLFLEKKLYNYDIIGLLSNFPFSPITLFIKSFAIEQGINIKRLCIVVFFAPIIEEVSKFVMTYAISIKTKHNDEAIDNVIYMITGALGFAFLENVFFLIEPIVRQETIFTVLTADVRFIGATLLHATASAIVGMAMAFSFFKGRITRTLAKVIGIFLAIVLHSVFNLFIIIDKGNEAIKALIIIWFVVIVILFLFERIKRVRLNKI
jgi:RsiW-degrading membrane proteinase PrsW (M82 family)